jgi:uncharacterized protein (DUF1015 family)
MIARLEGQNRYNIARLVKAPANGGPDPTGEHYRQARALLDQWTADGALAADQGAGFYPYTQTYTLGTMRLTRHGFIALGDLRDAGLFTHEETHKHVRDDRSRLRLATAADFGLIFMIYSDLAQSVDRILRDCESGTPILVADQPDGTTHRLYRCADPESTKRIQRQMADFDCVIADGHHRTAAAFDAWKESGDDKWAFTMMAFFNAEAPGMIVLPIHRAIAPNQRWEFGEFLETLADNFDVQEIPVAGLPPSDLASRLEGMVQERRRKDRLAFGMVGPDPEIAYLVEVRPHPNPDWPWPPKSDPVCRGLATAIFETGVLRVSLGYADPDIALGKGLSFPKDAVPMIESVRAGEKTTDRAGG